jgi:hypothetical protein
MLSSDGSNTTPFFISHLEHNIIGKRFGKLLVIEPMGLDDFNNRLWTCKCSCGKEVIVSTHNLNSGHTFSCGCHLAEVASSLMYYNIFRRVRKLW